MGWATADEKGVITCPAKLPRSERLSEMAHWADTFIGMEVPDFVIYYRPFARGADATRCGWGIVGIIEAAAAKHAAAVDDIDEAKVRSYHGLIPPKGMKQGERRKWLKQKALDKCRELGYLDIRNDDEADAVLLLEYATANLKVTK